MMPLVSFVRLRRHIAERILVHVGVIWFLLSGLAPASQLAMTPRWDPLYDPGIGGWSVAIEASPFDSHKLIITGDILGVGTSDDGGQTWQPSTGLIAGWEMGDVTFHPTDPNVVWVGSLSGPYKSTDGGKTWLLKRNGFPPFNEDYYSAPIQKVCFDPNNSNILLAFGGNHRHMTQGGEKTKFGAVWKSTDAGEHWKLLTSIDVAAIGSTANGRGVNLMTGGFAGGTSNIVYTCSDEGGVYKSVDGGASFTKINTGLPTKKICFIAIHSKNPNILWASMEEGKGVYKSIDGGAHWKNSSNGIDDLKPRQYLPTIAICAGNPDVLYVSECRYQDPCSIYRSDDGGDHWIKIVNNGSERGFIGSTAWSKERILLWWMSVDPKNPKHVLGMSQEIAVQSWDGGETWQDITSHAVDGGWRGNGYSGQCGTAVLWNPYRLGQVFTLGMDAGKVLHSNNYLRGWDTDRPLPLSPYMGGNCAGFARDGTIYVGFGQHSQSHYEGLGKSTDWGTTWAYTANPPGAKGPNRGVYVQPDNSKNVWAVAGYGAYKSTDGGASWNRLNLDRAGALYSMAADPTKLTTIYVGAEGGVYQTTDGTHFALMPGSPRGPRWNNVLVDPVSPATIYSTCYSLGDSGVWRMSDGKWTRIFDEPQARELAVDPADTARMAVITKDSPSRDVSRADGVWISEDAGQHWSECNTGICVTNGSAIAFNPDKSGQLIMGSDGGGFYVTDLGSSTPHGGKVRGIVGILHAVDYDDGFQGFNVSSQGRGNALIGLKAGQWVKYSVNVPTTGYYDLTVRAASTGGGKVHLEVNGVNVTGPVSFKTARPERWNEVRVPHIRLVAGDQYMELYVETGGVNVKSVEGSQL